MKHISCNHQRIGILTVHSPHAQAAICNHWGIKNAWYREKNPGLAVKSLVQVMDPSFYLPISVSKRFQNILYFTWKVVLRGYIAYSCLIKASDEKLYIDMSCGPQSTTDYYVCWFSLLVFLVSMGQGNNGTEVYVCIVVAFSSMELLLGQCPEYILTFNSDVLLSKQ